MSTKSKEKRCILIIIGSFQDQRPQEESARHQNWKDTFVLLLLMKMQHAVYRMQFAGLLAEEILSYSSADAHYISAVISDYNVIKPITRSHTFIIFYILGGVKLIFVVSTTRCIYTCPVLSGMRPRPPPEVVWAIGFKLQKAWSDQV